MPKHPEFIRIPPPIDPGIHDKNSNPLKLCSHAKFDTFLSKIEQPAITTLFFDSDILRLKLLSLEHRFIRSESVFTNNYQYIGLNPHISIAAGYLKIGPIAFVIFIYCSPWFSL